MYTPSVRSSVASAGGLVHDAALVQHDDAIGQREELGQLGGDEQHGAAGVALARRCSRWMNSIAPRSTPRVGCAASRSRAARVSSRATTSFCWLPPESLPRARRRIGRAHVELGQRAAVAKSRTRRAVEQRAATERGLAVAAEHEVVLEREVEHQAALQPVVGHVGDAQRGAGARA